MWQKKEQKDGSAVEEGEPSSRAEGDEFAESFEKQISSKKQKLASNSCTHERGAADQGDTSFPCFNVSLIVMKCVLINLDLDFACAGSKFGSTLDSWDKVKIPQTRSATLQQTFILKLAKKNGLQSR